MKHVPTEKSPRHIISAGVREDDERFASLVEANPDAITFDGFDEAYIGVATQFGKTPVAAYDYAKCIKILRTRDGMTREDAREFMEFNVTGLFVGPSTPIFVEA